MKLLRHIAVNHDGPPCPVCRKPTKARYTAAVYLAGPVRPSSNSDRLGDFQIPVEVEVVGAAFHHDCGPTLTDVPQRAETTEKGDQP